MEDNKNQPIIPSRDNINKFSEGTDCKSAIPENDRIDGRIAYIDCLRGFTMLLVIWNHVADMSFGLGLSDSFWTQLFISFRMPMFFFISGFIAYKAANYFSLNNTWKLLKKKAQVQLIPTVFFWTIGVLIIKGKSIQQIPDTFMEWFPGYWWFTEGLFIMFILYYSSTILEHYIHRSISFLILFVEVIVLMATLNMFRENFWAARLVLPGISKYFMFFVFGLFMSKYREKFFLAISNNVVMTTCIIIVFCITYFSYGGQFHFSHNEMALIRIAVGFPFICIVFALFRNSSKYWISNSSISKTLRFIGRRTLDLYVLHFFFLPDMKEFYHYLAGTHQTVQQITVVTAVTFVVAIICLTVSHVIRLSPFLAKYLFGSQIKK